ncbi:MAG: roadblock/LC7 domain-containing protein [Trueperaceae bacterium]|nr:roadblock/LC7 domain-containing protein [Trueperaceae bacterium]
MRLILDEALAVPGVTAAAVVDGDGELLATATREAPGFEDAGAELAASLAAARVLAESLGGGLNQSVLEYRGGPVVLAVAPRPAGAPEASARVLVLRLRALGDLGRARFELPRLLANLAAA